MTLHYIALHYMTLYCITLYYISGHRNLDTELSQRLGSRVTDLDQRLDNQGPKRATVLGQEHHLRCVGMSQGLVPRAQSVI